MTIPGSCGQRSVLHAVFHAKVLGVNGGNLVPEGVKGAVAGAAPFF